MRYHFLEIEKTPEERHGSSSGVRSTEDPERVRIRSDPEERTQLSDGSVPVFGTGEVLVSDQNSISLCEVL